MQRTLAIFTVASLLFLTACGKEEAPKDTGSKGGPQGNVSSQQDNKDDTAKDAYYDKYREAIARYSKIIEQNPNEAWAYNSRGVQKSELGDHKGAIEDYTKAIELNPNDTAAYTNRGSAKFRAGDYEGALTDFDKAVTLDPSLKNKLKSFIDDARGKLGR